ncbi:MAG: AAA family ATPase [Chloroflexi bacterium]|nr:AAA family ATPase [Chloroflexota bacterium]
MQTRIEYELEALIEKLPPHIQEPLKEREDINELLEVVLDLGREPEARFLGASVLLDLREVTQEDIEYVIKRIGTFGEDNRAGIERTLHRISAIRNRNGKIIGLTLRVGRAVFGTIRIIEDLIFTGKSVLLLGKPGVGKTTMLREVARVLADDAHKRVIVVDTSNEIAGDGDIPHPGIGRARRMQVPSPDLQHAVMIEAVENHMPEVIIIDEIGTELDANAARTIAERGVQLVATAHGNALENLILNPTLSDLIGGVQSVTLGDIEARRRRTQKTVLERKAPPTFDILVEIQSWNGVAVHEDVAVTVDRLLRGFPIAPEMRTLDENAKVKRVPGAPKAPPVQQNGRSPSRNLERPIVPEIEEEQEEEEALPVKMTHILPYGVNKGKLQQAVRGLNAPVELVGDMKEADLLLTTKNFYRRKTTALRNAEESGKPVYVLRKNTMPQIQQFIQAIARKQGQESDEDAALGIEEAEDAVSRIERGEGHVELGPQKAYVRRLQHKVASKYGLASASMGREPSRHVVMYKR